MVLEFAFSVIPNYLLPNAAAVEACGKKGMAVFLHLSSWIGRNNTGIRKFTNRSNSTEIRLAFDQKRSVVYYPRWYWCHTQRTTTTRVHVLDKHNVED